MGQDPGGLPTLLSRPLPQAPHRRRKDPTSAPDLLISCRYPGFTASGKSRRKGAFPDRTGKASVRMTAEIFPGPNKRRKL